MNVCLSQQLDAKLEGNWTAFREVPKYAHTRVAAMLPSGPLAVMLAGCPVILKVMGYKYIYILVHIHAYLYIHTE
jgi:hypothetical protein